MSLGRFFLLFFILSSVSGLTAYVAEVRSPADTILIPKFWVVFGFLVVMTLIAYLLSSFGLKAGGENSIYILMGAIIIKLLFCMGFVLLYLLKFKVNSLSFAVQFFSLYFLFTSFEVYSLLCNLRHQNKT